MGEHKIEPTPQELRQFGLISGAIVIVLFGLLLPWIFDHSWPLWPWVLAAVLGLIALAYPRALGPVYRVWMAFGHVMGWINTRVLLGAVFYLMLFPIGALMRLFGHDPMQRKPDPAAESYRKSSPEQPSEHFERPF